MKIMSDTLNLAPIVKEKFHVNLYSSKPCRNKYFGRLLEEIYNKFTKKFF